MQPEQLHTSQVKGCWLAVRLQLLQLMPINSRDTSYQVSVELKLSQTCHVA
jgi:hypothetical protein